MNTKNIIAYIILAIFWAIMFYLSWLSWILEYILALITYTLIFFLFYYLWKRYKQREMMSFVDFTNYFLYRISIFLVVLVASLWWLAYLSNEVYPAPMPEYTLSNWEKTVVFQWMIHIWAQDFYDNVANNLKEFKKEGWVYFYEWVWAWSEENMEKFNKAMWVKFDEHLYKHFSKLYWVVFQDQRQFMWLENDLDFNVDLDIDTIVELYDSSPNRPEDEWEPIDVASDLMETLSELNERELKVLVYINQSILNFIVASDGTQGFLKDTFGNKELFKVILDKRNEVLSKGIVDSEYDKIYITYWLLHFKWVLELLKQDDPNWKIVKTRNYYPIK